MNVVLLSRARHLEEDFVQLLSNEPSFSFDEDRQNDPPSFVGLLV